MASSISELNKYAKRKYKFRPPDLDSTSGVLKFVQADSYGLITQAIAEAHYLVLTGHARSPIPSKHKLEPNQNQSQVELVCSPGRVTVGSGYTHLKEMYV
jgi:hypothetical protein